MTRSTSATTVSIVIPTYNRAALLRRAIASVVAQTYAHWEIVLVDDGSTDETPEVVGALRAELGGRLRHLRREHGGASAARNTGIDHARGEFVAFLDSDDEFLPTKLARQLELLDLRPDLGLVFSDMSYTDLHGRTWPSAFDANLRAVRGLVTRVIAPGRHVCGSDFFDHLLSDYLISTIVGLVRRDVLGDAVRFPVGRMYCEEWLFYLEVARRCRVGFVDEALSHHHHVGGSLSRTAAERNNVHLREALRTALTRYPDASEEARRAVALRLARCCRQLGFDHYRAGDYARAAEHFAEARALRPNRRDTWYLIESTVRSKLGFRHRRRPRVESGPAGAMLGAGVVGGTPPTARN